MGGPWRRLRSRPSIGPRPMPRRSAIGRSFAMPFSRESPLNVVNAKAFCVLLRVLWIEDSVGEFDRTHVGGRNLHAQFLHGGEIQVRSKDLFGYLFVIGRGLDHAPAAELAEPPVPVRSRWEITVALGEDH